MDFKNVQIDLNVHFMLNTKAQWQQVAPVFWHQNTDWRNILQIFWINLAVKDQFIMINFLESDTEMMKKFGWPIIDKNPLQKQPGNMNSNG